MNEIVRYYDQLADRYDEDRFGGTYGRFVDHQERQILRRWLPATDGAKILDLGCGTGRFLDLATHGQDPSPRMLQMARKKHPAKPLAQGGAPSRIEFDLQFDAIMSLHVFMHLDPGLIRALLHQCHAHLKPGGFLIFDIPSAERRRISNRRDSGWHGDTAMTEREINQLTGDGWHWRRSNGVMFLPVHRIPQFARTWCRGLDAMICRSPLDRFASYRLVQFERKP